MYWSTLDVTGTGMMGYVTVPKISQELPVYHGTSNSVLSAAAGHFQGTSLPVGGARTHCVVSAHRGLPTAVLFTHLDRMEIGDTFYFTILDRTITSEVDQIRIVEPDETDELLIQQGKDLCTLVTCTPYGVNSHRLLVRGHRVENMAQAVDVRITADAVVVEKLVVAPFVLLPILLVMMIWLFVSTGKRKK